MKFFSGTYILLAVVLTAVFPVQGAMLGSTVTGDGPVVTETRTLPSFSKIIVKGSMDAKISRSDTQRVTINAQENLLPLIQTNVDDDTLIIETESSCSTTATLRIDITLPDLRSAAVDGSGDILVTGPFDMDTLILEIQGSGDIRLKESAVGELDCHVMGSGDIVLSGTAETARYKVKGSGDIDAYGMPAKTVIAHIHGSGDIRTRADGRLDAKIYGSGDIHYTGHPEVTRSVFGSGDVVKK